MWSELRIGPGAAMKRKLRIADPRIAVVAISCVGGACVDDWPGGTPVTSSPPEGAVSFDLPQGECGTVPAAHYTIPTDREPMVDSAVVARVRDGEDGATVQCTIDSQADGAVFDGQLALAGTTFHAVGNVQPLGDDTYPGEGTVQYSTPAFGDLSSAPDACSITVSTQQALLTDSYRIIVASFVCPSMDGGDTTSEVSQCAITGRFAFAGCGA